MKSIVYMRISTDGQTFESQRYDLEKWLERNPREVEWIEDVYSSQTTERPGMLRLKAMIEAGEVDTVIVQRLDRLSRKLAQGLVLLAEWADRGIRIVAVTQEIDLSGPVGRLVAAVLLGVAEMEYTIRRERQAAGIAAAKARGVKFGRRHGTLPALTRARMKAKSLRYMQLFDRGFTVPEIAKVTATSESQVRIHLRRAFGRPPEAERERRERVALLAAEGMAELGPGTNIFDPLAP